MSGPRAILSCDMEYAKTLFPTGPSTGCSPAIFDMIIKSQVDQVKLLLGDNTVDVNAGDEDDLSPLHLAVELEKEEIVKILIENGAKVNKFTLDLVSKAIPCSNCIIESNVGHY